ncbi:MAG: phosphoribosylamine--glycine ligase [Chloroflexi bacterium CFX7]|nr:phosphoribosylamine--glycine ligase [Chloroflexi bacterium CFX7]MCL4230104.1 phosphoribosylamine--glycine ligase [Dehalococcoidia bacterium]
MGERVLLVGSGGREHAIAWKLRQSPRVDEIFIAPGNAGTATLGANVNVQPKDIDGLVKAARELRITFYLATMDDPQPLGLVDRLSAEGILCYGPTAAAAQLEASKAFSKEFMVRHGIRTAAARTFTEYAAARAYVESLQGRPLVVKASGLAAGKGAIVCATESQAMEALDIIMLRRDFGSAGNTVLVEERLVGWETSAHAFCDGRSAIMMPFASDHKRAQDGDIGLNTGGMGAYSPSELVSDALAAGIRSDVVERTIAGMAAEGTPFAGTLFPGLMVTESGAHVLEFNARFGDPEAQVLMPRLESDLFEVCEAAARGKLHETRVRWSDRPTVGVVMASGGYPATYKLGHIIEGTGRVDPGVLVFHAGTKDDARGLVTNGGRVLTVVASGATLAEARALAYANVKRIHFTDAHYRTDIALRAVR